MLLPPAVPTASDRSRHSGAFTLVELLAVVALMALLLGITLGSLRGSKEQAAVGRARSELAVLSQALEDYRREYGDYPQTADTPEKLYQALIGRLGPTGASISGRSLLDGVQIALHDPLHPGDVANHLVDPWGNSYRYVYFIRQAGTEPVRRGRVLYSLGGRPAAESLPTREDVVPEVVGEFGGVISTAAGNARNLYAQP